MSLRTILFSLVCLDLGGRAGPGRCWLIGLWSSSRKIELHMHHPFGPFSSMASFSIKTMPIPHPHSFLHVFLLLQEYGSSAFLCSSEERLGLTFFVSFILKVHLKEVGYHVLGRIVNSFKKMDASFRIIMQNDPNVVVHTTMTSPFLFFLTSRYKFD